MTFKTVKRSLKCRKNLDLFIVNAFDSKKIERRDMALVITS